MKRHFDDYYPPTLTEWVINKIFNSGEAISNKLANTVDHLFGVDTIVNIDICCWCERWFDDYCLERVTMFYRPFKTYYVCHHCIRSNFTLLELPDDVYEIIHDKNKGFEFDQFNWLRHIIGPIFEHRIQHLTHIFDQMGKYAVDIPPGYGETELYLWRLFGRD